MSTRSEPFVHGYLLDRHGKGHEIDAAAVADWKPEQGLLWVHLELTSEAAKDWLLEKSGLEEPIAEAMTTYETRPRAIPTDEGLLVILRGVNMNPGSDPEDMVAVRVWIEENRIISVRRRRLLSIQDVRQALAAGIGPHSSGEFLIMLAERLAFRIGDVVNRIEAAVDAADAQVNEGDVRSLQREVGSLRQQTAAIRRHLAPQRDALNRIRGRTNLLTSAEMHDLEEQSDLVTRYLEDLDLTRESAILVQEQLTSRLANEQNARLYMLSIVAAIFLPLSFITGLLGMNVGGLPGLDFQPAFWISVAVMCLIAAALLVYFRFKKWI